MRGINCINNISLGKFELFCFMLAIVFIPFHVIHKFMTVPVLDMGSKLSIYPIILGIGCYFYQAFKKRTTWIPKKYVYFVISLFVVQFFSTVNGLLVFPYWSSINIDQFEKLVKLVSLIPNSDSILNQDSNIIGIIWLSIKIIIKLMFNFLTTYGCSLWIISLYIRCKENVFKYFYKGIIGGALLCTIYSIVEYVHLFGGIWASIILTKINPLFYDVASSHNWWPPLFYGNRVRSLFAEPAYLSTYLSIAIPVSIYYAMVKKTSNWLWKLLPVILIIMMLTTNSKTAIGILIAECALVSLLLLIQFRKLTSKTYFKKVIKNGIWILCAVIIGLGCNSVLRDRYSIDYDVTNIQYNHIITLKIENTGWIAWNDVENYQLTAAWYDKQWNSFGRVNVTIPQTMRKGDTAVLTIDLPKLSDYEKYSNVVIELQKFGPYETGELAGQGANKLTLNIEDGHLIPLKDLQNEVVDMSAIASTSNGSNQQRFGMMRVDYNIGKEYPILGVGGNDLKQAYVISNIPDSLKHNAEVKLWIQSQNENGIFKSSFPVISEYPHQFAVYGTLGLIGFLIPSGYIICQLLGLYKKWLHIDQELFWKIFSLVVGYFGLMVSFIAGTTMQLYLYWIMLGTMISLLLSIKNEIL